MGNRVNECKLHIYICSSGCYNGYNDPFNWLMVVIVMNIHYWGFDSHPYMRDKTLKREVRSNHWQLRDSYRQSCAQ